VLRPACLLDVTRQPAARARVFASLLHNTRLLEVTREPAARARIHGSRAARCNLVERTGRLLAPNSSARMRAASRQFRGRAFVRGQCRVSAPSSLAGGGARRAAAAPRACRGRRDAAAGRGLLPPREDRTPRGAARAPAGRPPRVDERVSAWRCVAVGLLHLAALRRRWHLRGLFLQDVKRRGRAATDGARRPGRRARRLEAEPLRHRARSVVVGLGPCGPGRRLLC